MRRGKRSEKCCTMGTQNNEGLLPKMLSHRAEPTYTSSTRRSASCVFCRSLLLFIFISIMPKIISPRTQRHYPPLTNRCAFKPELLMPRPLLTSRRIFPLSEDLAGLAQASSTSRTVSQNLITKPPGEVGRLSRNGYNLEETLNWGKDLYTSVQAR